MYAVCSVCFESPLAFIGPFLALLQGEEHDPGFWWHAVLLFTFPR